MYTLSCGRHRGYLLPDSLRRRPETALRCRACHHAGSKLWREALRVLQECVANLGPIAFEVYVLPGLHKRFDIYLLQWGVAIEVDGSQHFSGSYYAVPWEVQYVWDREVDELCRQQGQRLVRLHYRDQHEWASTVQAALSSQQVVTYTCSYGL